jgi:hypothetical protein
MKKISLSVISTLLLLQGCVLFSDHKNTTSTIPPIPPQQNPTPIPDTPKNNINNNISTTSGLIPSTNPTDRLPQISQGRNDPFDSITPPGVIKVKTDQIIAESVASNKAIVKESPAISNQEGGITKAVDNQGVSKNNVANAGVANNKNNGVNVTGNNLSAFQPPMPPSPSDAQKIVVSGILNLNDENVALIQTPWDNVTRSVRIGDIVSDNTSGISVRVKDINFGYPTTIALQEDNQTVLRSLNDDNRVIILEQFGQRVTRSIGETNDSLAKL